MHKGRLRASATPRKDEDSGNSHAGHQVLLGQLASACTSCAARYATVRFLPADVQPGRRF
ncbi:MAG: hypothetical protein QOI86_4532 [Actinomycetota bacterium]|nr:hypothetical protein [Actinomycetota bacterium]